MVRRREALDIQARSLPSPRDDSDDSCRLVIVRVPALGYGLGVGRPGRDDAGTAVAGRDLFTSRGNATRIPGCDDAQAE